MLSSVRDEACTALSEDAVLVAILQLIVESDLTEITKVSGTSQSLFLVYGLAINADQHS